jgi:hypothetical protein
LQRLVETCGWSQQVNGYKYPASNGKSEANTYAPVLYLSRYAHNLHAHSSNKIAHHMTATRCDLQDLTAAGTCTLHASQVTTLTLGRHTPHA